MNRYVIIAGVNGAGKSTFYSTENLFSNIEKVNLDDVVREIGESGNIADVVKAGRIVLEKCDLAAIYDNTDKFRRFAIFKDGKCVRLSRYVPDWYKKAMDVYTKQILSYVLSESLVVDFVKESILMSRVKKPKNKFMNTAHYDNSVYGPSKLTRIHCAGEDFHNAKTLSHWLFVKYDMSYKAYRNKSKNRRDELRIEFEADTGVRTDEIETGYSHRILKNQNEMANYSVFSSKSVIARTCGHARAKNACKKQAKNNTKNRFEKNMSVGYVTKKQLSWGCGRGLGST